jgi:hypothetical protein
MRKRRSRVVYLLVILVFTILILAIIIFTYSEMSTQTRVPGVSPGDTFTYGVSSFWNSSDPNAVVPQILLDINQTSSCEVRISEVSDSNITTFVVLYFKNGTADAGYGLVDVDTGVSYGRCVAIIAVNLTAHDIVYPLGADSITINQTVIKSYESGNRETDRIVIEYTNATTGVTGWVDSYFDKATGMLVELCETTLNSNPESTTIITWKIKSSNVWTVT